jgi:hypothetical protein
MPLLPIYAAICDPPLAAVGASCFAMTSHGYRKIDEDCPIH